MSYTLPFEKKMYQKLYSYTHLYRAKNIVWILTGSSISEFCIKWYLNVKSRYNERMRNHTTKIMYWSYYRHKTSNELKFHIHNKIMRNNTTKIMFRRYYRYENIDELKFHTHD